MRKVRAFVWKGIRVFCPGGGGVVPYIGYIGMFGAKGYGF